MSSPFQRPAIIAARSTSRVVTVSAPGTEIVKPAGCPMWQPSKKAEVKPALIAARSSSRVVTVSAPGSEIVKPAGCPTWQPSAGPAARPAIIAARATSMSRAVTVSAPGSEIVKPSGCPGWHPSARLAGTRPAGDAVIGCETTTAQSFWLRPTPTLVHVGPVLPAGTRIRVLESTDVTGPGLRVYRVQVLSNGTHHNATGYAALSMPDFQRRAGSCDNLTRTAVTTPVTPDPLTRIADRADAAVRTAEQTLASQQTPVIPTPTIVPNPTVATAATTATTVASTAATAATTVASTIGTAATTSATTVADAAEPFPYLVAAGIGVGVLAIAGIAVVAMNSSKKASSTRQNPRRSSSRGR